MKELELRHILIDGRMADGPHLRRPLKVEFLDGRSLLILSDLSFLKGRGEERGAGGAG